MPIPKDPLGVVDPQSRDLKMRAVTSSSSPPYQPVPNSLNVNTVHNCPDSRSICLENRWHSSGLPDILVSRANQVVTLPNYSSRFL
ncbi:hypothetical protein M8J77_022361 [Diaphorina citri]|nr:hypothetical protein M8J77_022361 [Diaphorina citri]